MNTDRQDALTLLHDLYLDDDEGFIEVRAIYPHGSRPRDWRKSIKGAVRWVDERDERGSGPALYFGIGKRKSGGVDHDGDELKPKGGTKDDVLSIPAIWAEIDTDREGLVSEAVMPEIEGLPLPLRPSALVHSGHGLHLYWFLEDPLHMTPESAREVETTNVIVQEVLGSDPIHDVPRVLRLPSTWNNKVADDPIRARLLWSDRDRRFSLGAIKLEWSALGERVSDLLPSLLLPIRRIPLTSGRTSSGVASTVSWSPHTSISKEELRERTRYHAGPGYFGVDEASARMVAKYHCEGYPDDWAIQRTVEFIRGVKDEQAPQERWDWPYEREKVRSQLERWKPKWAAHLATVRLTRKRSKAKSKPGPSPTTS